MKTESFVALALAVAGCSGVPRLPDNVLDSSKLDAATSVRLDAARRDLEQSRVAVARAKDQVVYARQEERLAESKQKLTQVEFEQAKKAFEDAELRKEAADARHAYAEKLVDAREAAEEVAKARVDLADAKLEHAKVVAIQQSSAQAGAQFLSSEFTERITNTQRNADKAEREAREFEQDATARQRRWGDLARKAPPAT